MIIIKKLSEAEILTKKISQLRNSISLEVGNSTMDLIDELVNAEIELERECH